MDKENSRPSPVCGDDLPRLMLDPARPLIYNVDDTDGIYFMINRRLSGCAALFFSRPMSKNAGWATLDGKPLPAFMETMHLDVGTSASCLGVPLRGKLRYGQHAVLSIGGWTDQEGRCMAPVDIEVYAEEQAQPEAAFAAHEALALQAAEDGIVLLKNEGGLLPLPEGTTLNFFGKGLHEFRTCAVGAGKTNQRYTIGLLQAACRETHYTVNQALADFYACGEDRVPDQAMLAQARAQSDTAIMVLTRAAGENQDITSDPGEFELSADERGLIDTLRDTFAHVAVVLNVGHPISLAFTREKGVDAVLYSGFGGMLGGQAIVNVLTGRVNPSGKLPDTWADHYADIPSAANFYDARQGKPRFGADDSDVWLDTVYEENIFVGYRYFESTAKELAHYPFGFGLSYTTFALTVQDFRPTEENVVITVSVTNTGRVAGREVVQIYLHKPEGARANARLELVHFAKTKLLAPGESETLAFRVAPRRMSGYDEALGAFVMEKGCYTFYAGNSVAQLTCCGEVNNPARRVVRHAPVRMKAVCPIHAMQSAQDSPCGACSGVKQERRLSPLRPVCFPTSSRKPRRTEARLTFADVRQHPEQLTAFVDSLSVEQLARISVCFSHGWGMEGRGEAGRLARPEGLELPAFVVADGNSGVNLNDKNIGLPSGTTLCASFDRALMEQVGRVIGEEARRLGIDMILATAFNLHRNPLNGRNAEYFSEDPLLAGVMAGCYCRGLEGAGVGGCYTHVMANNAETSRKRNQSVIPQQALRELYFAAFEYALEEYEPLSVMTSYNAVNGRFTSADPELIQGLLMEELHFQGFVMTDWSSYDTADVVEMAAAGVSWITPGSSDDTFTAPLVQAVRSGKLSEGQLRDNVQRLLDALLKLEQRKGAAVHAEVSVS